MPYEERTKYLPGFREAVKALLGPKGGQWSTTYTEEAAREQALRQAYQDGRLDGLAEALRPAAPSAPESPEEPAEAPEAVWERLGLFEPPMSAPGPVSAALASAPELDDALTRARMIRVACVHLGLDLAEGTAWVDALLEVDAA